jgi:hypothetical protein
MRLLKERYVEAWKKQMLVFGISADEHARAKEKP